MVDLLKFLIVPDRLHLMPAMASGAGRRRVDLPLDGLALALQRAGAASLAEVRSTMTLIWPAALPADALAPVLSRHLVAAALPDSGLVQSLDGSLLHCEPGRIQDADGSWQGLGAEFRWGRLRVRRVERPLAPAARSLRERIEAAPELHGFAQALRRTGLDRLLDCAGPFTVFAPEGAALELDAERLRHHLLPGRWPSPSLPWGQTLRTLADQALALGAAGHIGVGPTAQPLLPLSDQACRNGVLHRMARPLLA